ncbi:glyceraldehyde-3-phosphate dehydrogenase [Candidatus Riesia sp. GBBU]|nr:glyceraldehyde-3-phosphate dehydrogenase [Candidatus Riesia sp. GBBU]
MKINVGINGFGRIGRAVFRLSQKRKDIRIVAINDLLRSEQIAYMLKYDSTHGRFNGDIRAEKNCIIVNNKKIQCISETNPKNINWKEFKVNSVIDATGLFLDKNRAVLHIDSGAEKVILTAPSGNVPMFVIGVNHKTYKGQKIVSNASCTTNCLAPIAKVINDKFGIVEGLMTTVHSVTATQKTVDGASNKNWRDGRGALQNIIPSTTGATQATTKIIPELSGKLLGMAFRVSTPNVSVVDFTVSLEEEASFYEICQEIKRASEEEMNGILCYTDEEVVSSDFNGSTFTSIFDAKASIPLNKRFVKLISWYDNETGYSSKLLDLVSYISNY